MVGRVWVFWNFNAARTRLEGSPSNQSNSMETTRETPADTRGRRRRRRERGEAEP